MSRTDELTHAVLLALLDPDAEFVEVAARLGISLTDLLEIAESPPVTGAIEALEKLSQIRARALLAQSAHVAIAALERIADTTPETPAARETARKAAAQLLRMAAKAAPIPDAAQPEHAAPESPDVRTPASRAPHEHEARRAVRPTGSNSASEIRNSRFEIPDAPPDTHSRTHPQPYHANGAMDASAAGAP